MTRQAPISDKNHYRTGHYWCCECEREQGYYGVPFYRQVDYCASHSNYEQILMAKSPQLGEDDLCPNCIHLWIGDQRATVYAIPCGCSGRGGWFVGLGMGCNKTKDAYEYAQEPMTEESMVKYLAWLEFDWRAAFYCLTPIRNPITKHPWNTKMDCLEGQMIEDHVNSVVYFIRNDETQDIKIGTSFRVGNRLGQLQSTNGSRLTLLATLPGSFQTEAYLHEYFSDLRKRGEWFRNGERLLVYLVNAIGRVDGFKLHQSINDIMGTTIERMEGVG